MKYMVGPGQRFGRLVTLNLVQSGRRERWLCQCDCGKTKIVSKLSLVHGKTTSCRCLANELTTARNTTHGKTKTRTYRIWQAMINRCKYPSNKAWKHYGGRWISVCEEWKESFTLFLKDMGEAPPGHTIERVNSNGNYEPSNCRWATQSDQTRNTSRSRLITFRGVTKCLTDWAKDLAITKDTLDYRIKKWGVDRALTTPRSSRHNTKEI